VPLAFDTVNQGTIAVGFFNVESDMFLVGDYLLFASDLCGWIAEQAARIEPDYSEDHEVWRVEPQAFGDLHGAMGGWDPGGFLGEVYARYPFPALREEFHQKPQGYRTRAVFEEMVARHGTCTVITLRADSVARTYAFGRFVFAVEWWRAVIDYLWRGGMPRWQDEERPEYVKAMAQAVEGSEHWLYNDRR
jgi:hypothetical protein